ncbi:P-loop containing nucleoside triphosphate hydrolase protein [Atractiella rhizophila]|nr:P-loop containing nucleoside triphosphate hydrolase protein [Atractiella rhizophila]
MVATPSGSLFSKWEALGLDATVVKSLVRYGIGPPSKIQQKSIPALLKQNDIVAQAAAISERIQSYIIPSIHMVLHSASFNLPRPGNIQILMITCTIDEASQCHRLAVGLGAGLGIRASISVGNGDLNQELQTIQGNMPHILIGTPARILDIVSTRILNMNELRLVVLDEGDQLVARNLTDLVTGIFKHIPQNMERQTAIYSCTIPQEVLTFASSSLNLREPVRVLVRREQSDSGSPSMRGLKQYYLYIAVGSNATTKLGNVNLSAREWKLEALIDLCEDYDFTQAVIYCASVDSTEAVTYKLASRGIDALALHQDMGGPARHSVLSKFRSSAASTPGMKASKKCLVVYDALCRSLNDVHQVPLVINFDLPRAPEDYVHRVACATSAGHVRPGVAINFLVDNRDIDMLRQIEGMHRTRISELPPYACPSFSSTRD